MALWAASRVVHLVIASGVGYALTGSVAIAGAITRVEPVVDTIAHDLFDRWCRHAATVAAGARWRERRGWPAGAAG